MPAGRADRNSAWLQPYLHAKGESTEEYPVMKPHAPNHASLGLPGGRSGLVATRRMPAVGYTGHLRGTQGNASQCFGTSHWRAKPPVSRSDAALAAFDQAQERGKASLADDNAKYEC